ncbi:MAG: hypothetical protein MZV63_20300 [Marinilabiliales bacterium]|nr:hypothetical protein [Marinilabiliales bacterium]
MHGDNGPDQHDGTGRNTAYSFFTAGRAAAGERSSASSGAPSPIIPLRTVCSEGVALTMHQDREGFMWFGTFDGLNRFDGYSFKVYKSGFRRSYALTNNRVDRITEDDLGYLWIMNNDGEVYRMNTTHRGVH